MIGRNGERRSGISAQAARHDDDDDDFDLLQVTCAKVILSNTKTLMILHYFFIFRAIVLIFVAMNITTFRPLYGILLLEYRTKPFILLTEVDGSSSTSFI